MAKGWVGKAIPIEVRFWSKVDKTSSPNGCWLWVGAKTKGYGMIMSGGPNRRVVLSHRISYEIIKGPIPEGLELDHLCRNHSCVNPAHLEAVTRRVNVLRGESPAAKAARRDHCIHGHPYNEENTARTQSGARRCRVCERSNGVVNRTHCRNGHEYNPENTVSFRGTRRCLICRKDWYASLKNR